MDAHADLHFSIADFESRTPDAGNRTRCQCHAHGTTRIRGFLRQGGNFLQWRKGLGFGSGHFVSVDQSRHAAPLGPFRVTCARHVIRDPHRGAWDSLHFDHFPSHVEIHVIAAVVAV